MAKIHLDKQLIASARRITTGANIHHIKQLIFVYEQAVSLYNSGWPTHRVYQCEHENALRQFVAKELQLRFLSNSQSELRAGRVKRSEQAVVGKHAEVKETSGECATEADANR
jgi:hypothetical protein